MVKDYTFLFFVIFGPFPKIQNLDDSMRSKQSQNIKISPTNKVLLHLHAETGWHPRCTVWNRGRPRKNRAKFLSQNPITT